MGKKRLHVCLATSLLSVFLIGCGGVEKEPPTGSSPASSPTGDNSPRLPWEYKNEKGEVSFIRHWFSTFRSAANSGEGSTLRALSSRNCEACGNYARKAEELHEGEAEFKMSKFSVPFVVKSPKDSGIRGDYVIRLTKRVEWKTDSSGSKSVTKVDPESYEVTVKWQSGEWKMLYLNLLRGQDD